MSCVYQQRTFRDRKLWSGKLRFPESKPWGSVGALAMGISAPPPPRPVPFLEALKEKTGDESKAPTSRSRSSAPTARPSSGELKRSGSDSGIRLTGLPEAQLTKPAVFKLPRCHPFVGRSVTSTMVTYA
eukprot:TRINITY_DN29814_c0_g1_i1.p1 TRINITY_DN29814_c0_g1~~TRINITY_DN29814_c0_g1_i1.p1  ORF type:complete len:129 (-),score=9.64 TRINITY_DN29814_c0_g1_i1:331-717(-)